MNATIATNPMNAVAMLILKRPLSAMTKPRDLFRFPDLSLLGMFDL